ncbi:MAG: hypothetical protein ACRDTX_21960 [Pseudonocardiaceae bacterium]
MVEALVLTCGSARWPGTGTATAVPARPGREELDPLLAALTGRRVVVCGTDADLAAVVLRLLRTEILPTVAVGYVPVEVSSAVARLWDLPTVPAAAASLALHGDPDPVPLVRDDAGGVLVGRGVVAPLDGVAYCDDEVVLRGCASRLEVTPDREFGLEVRVVRRGLITRRARSATGRAMQLGCAPTDVWCDGVAGRITDRWTWYRHTEDWQLIRSPS